MGTCEHCNADIQPGRRQRFCSTACGTAFHNANRPEPKQTDIETPEIHKRAQELVVSGYLPLPFQIDAHDQRPLWDFYGLAALLDQRPDALVELLIQNGAVHLSGDRGVPSSWKALIEL
jgi:hypothetical protein